MNSLISFFNRPLSLSWSAHPTNLLAILLVIATGAAIAALTIWTYSGQLGGNRRRILLLIALRLLALLVVLLTALRPAYPIDDPPKIRTQLLIGIDVSESMTVRDEVGNSTRIDAVRRTLESCQPTLDALQTEQNMTVTLYGFGASGFTEAAGAYDPAAPVNAQQSDYRTYLAKTLEKWQGQKFVFNQAAGAEWLPFRIPGLIARDTTINHNTKGVADVKVVRRGDGHSPWVRHQGDILFNFVMEGLLLLEGEGKEPFRLSPGDAFVIPPGLATRYTEASADLELLEVALPAAFETEVL